MAVDYSALNADIEALVTQVSVTETTEAGAITLINGFAAQVAAAVTATLAADDAANQVTVDAVKQTIADVTARFVASGGALGTAVAAGPPPA